MDETTVYFAGRPHRYVEQKRDSWSSRNYHLGYVLLVDLATGQEHYCRADMVMVRR